jgi:hypothetical protein
MPQVIFHHLLYVSVQLANKRGFNKKKTVGFWRPNLFGRHILGPAGITSMMMMMMMYCV